jgi:DNA processing protein
MTDLEASVCLSSLPSPTLRIAAERLRAGASVPDVLNELLAARGWSARQAELARFATAAVSRGLHAGLTAILWRTDGFPALLDALHDPPFVLWVRGSTECLAAPTVALVGSRAASEYALAVATRLGRDLASRGVTVVSGLARGVDSAAHRGALEGGGPTVAVLGSGADVIYPSEHRALAREIEASGAVVSELAPGTRPQPYFFPLRNRIISGFSRAVVVVEASEKSGSLITARSALEQGREVLAVPGNILSERNRGAHALLRDGAKIVESADDILEELGCSFAPRDPGPHGPDRVARECAPLNEGHVGSEVLGTLIPGEASDLDAISARSGLAPERLLAELLELELGGRVKRVDGSRFVRI